MNSKQTESPSSNQEVTEVPEKSFWRKIKNSATSAGYEAIHNALILYYTARAKETPLWCKTVIVGALGYFISLIDAIPDLTPILGYTDDISVMIAAVAALATHITPEIRNKAKEKADKLFKND